jgi:hypothetical protein
MNIRRWIAVGVAAVATTVTAATAATTPADAYSRQDLRRDLDAITATGVPGVLAEVRTGDRQLRGTSGGDSASVPGSYPTITPTYRRSTI